MEKQAALKKQQEQLRQKEQAQAKKRKDKVKSNAHFDDFIQYNEKFDNTNSIKNQKRISSDANYTVRNINSNEKIKRKSKKKKTKNIEFFSKQKKTAQRNMEEQSEKIIDLAQARAKRTMRIRLYKIAALCLIFVGIYATFTMLFQIESIEVVGKTQYSNTQILSAFGVEIGDNMFFFDANEKISNIQKTLPYIENVNITRSLPGTISIEVINAQEMYSVSCLSGWAVLSESLRVLNIVPTQPEQITYIAGISAFEPVAGEALQIEDERQYTVLTDLLNNAQIYKILPITDIDLSDMLQINFTYANRINIVLGTSNDMENKMEWAKYLITPTNEDALGENSKGILDVSNRDNAGRLQAIWRAES